MSYRAFLQPNCICFTPFCSRFALQREIKIHGMVSHKHLVKLMATFEDSQHIYLVQVGLGACLLLRHRPIRHMVHIYQEGAGAWLIEAWAAATSANVVARAHSLCVWVIIKAHRS